MKIADLNIIEIHEGRSTRGDNKGMVVVKMLVDRRFITYIVRPNDTETSRDRTYNSVSAAKRDWRIYHGGVRWRQVK